MNTKTGKEAGKMKLSEESVSRKEWSNVSINLKKIRGENCPLLVSETKAVNSGILEMEVRRGAGVRQIVGKKEEI